ncbi:MAG TPA: plastocyanin/azurin family copper-binding protein [Gemmatimonadales bacterium]|nr:plastocyanin/azurin family copper-binding protein [Gemmatimonadales bacterium]
MRTLLAGLLTLATASGCRPAAPAPTVHVVEISGMRFVPESLTVAVGDTVRWVDRDIVPHTATASGWDTGAILPGDTGSVVITAPGEVEYRCTMHPTMTARLAAR